MQYHETTLGLSIQNAVVTAGFFDGVHRGHRVIIDRVKEKAKLLHGESVVVSYWPHPRWVHSNDRETLKLLNSLEEKKEILQKIGIDHFIVLPFTKEFSQLSAEEYLENYLIRDIGARHMVVGYDHRFGRFQAGNYDLIELYSHRLGYTCEQMKALEQEEVVFSSSKIRHALEVGNMRDANKMLGYPYSLEGVVQHGNHLGAKIGFPTANIKLHADYKLLPMHGVYSTRIYYSGDVYYGMLYLGKRPSIKESGEQLRIEVNIFNFTKQIYNEVLKVELLDFIRGDMTFKNLNDLAAQLEIDKRHVTVLLGF